MPYRLSAFSTLLLAASITQWLAVGEASAQAPLEESATPPTATASTVPEAFKIFIQESGVYEVTFEQLRDAVEAPATLPPVPSAGLALTVDGQAVPVWIDDGGDGELGPGDRIEWVAQRRHGDGMFFHEHSRYNVYRLALDGTPRSMVLATAPPDADTEPRHQWRVLRVVDHLEEDRIRLRFGNSRQGQGGETVHRDVWHWAKLTHMDRRPFRMPLDLSNYDPRHPEPLSMRFEFSGWSKPFPRLETMPDHRVDVVLNGTTIGSGSWQGQDSYQLTIDAVDSRLIKKGKNVLELVVPKRFLPDGETWLIDVVLLNWLQLEYPRTHRLRFEQERFDLVGLRPGRSVALNTEPGQRIDFYGAHGWKLPAAAQSITDGESKTSLSWSPPTLETGAVTDDTVYAVRHGSLSRPQAVTVDHPSSLRPTEQQADYLMISHPRLRQAIEPLADLHRGRGLTVEVVDVEDIYDEFNHGVPDPGAIRDFIAHAYHHWATPRPQFVLLVGDASWDIKNESADDADYADWTYRPGEKRRFVKNSSYAYEDQPSDPAHRNLIPAWSYASYQGHAASDNGFVTVDGDDTLPDLAIGRLPVTEAADVAAIVEKTRRYVLDAPVGPWRRDILWITNEMRSFQNRSNRLANELADQGFGASKVYPSSDEADNLEHQAALRQSFDQGQLLVHFYGHGGRYIWRTGPPDLTKNHDLFTLDDLDRLSPTRRLPLVLSMSCYSAPFDHPTADSIGEKFLRLADRGAIAVLAASWRNSPSTRFSRRLTDELTQRQPMGEAIRRAKVDSKSEPMIALYNLLGDPAIPLALPQAEVPIDVTEDGRLVADLSALQLREGQALITWLTGQGEALASEELSFDTSTLQLPAPQDPASRQVQVYVWNEGQDRDGLGAFRLPQSMIQPVEPQTTTPGATATTATTTERR